MKTFKQYISENMDHGKDHEAVEELKSALLAKKAEIQSVENDSDKVYNIIDQLMKSVAKTHGLSGQQMHDMWVDCYKEVPDTWIMKESAAWQRSAGKDPEGGLNRKGIASYRRENPGSKLSMAVTTKPSKLKPGSKAANRRKSFCARMGGMKKRLTSAKTANDPDSRINKALRKWNC